MLDRSEKRRQLAQDKANFARGLDVRIRDGQQIASLMRVLYDLVRTSVAGQSVSPLMHWLYSNFSGATKAFAGSVEIDCRRGCSHCCQMWVDASPPEIIYIAKSLTGRTRVAASEAVTEAMAATGEMTFEQRAAFVSPCPMLRSGDCSVYAVRPLACRAAASSDADVCARAYNLKSDEQIPVPLPYMLVGSGYRLALTGAIKRAGLTHDAVELNSGLSTAFSNQEIEHSWLAGEDVFSMARKPPVDDVLDNNWHRPIYDAAFDGY